MSVPGTASISRRTGDQAERLRTLAAQQATAAVAAVTALPALAITGGKGGVGKTCVAVNLGLLLVELGARPLLVDCDLGLANADVMLGVSPTATLYDVVLGGAAIDQAIVTSPAGLAFLPAASGRDELTRLQPRQFQRLLKDLGHAAAGYDLILFDTAAGIGRDVASFLIASRTVLVVVTPEPTSLTDAYALIKLVEAKQPGKDIRVLVNQAANQDEAAETFARLRKVAATYLKRDLVLAGHLPADRAVAEGVRRRKPFALNPDAPATRALRALATRIKAERWR